MRRQRRDVEGANLSFLDAIACGFGAIILLLVLTKTAEPFILEDTTQNLDGLVKDLENRVYEIRGEVKTLNSELTTKTEQLSRYKERIARLADALSLLQGRTDENEPAAGTPEVLEKQLLAARQRLNEVQQRLGFERPDADATIGGVPVDSEYIIFIIDTSGSMFNFAWDLVLQKLTEVLDVHPNVKGIQVMNDMGEYMFSQYRNQWIPDTPGRRRAIIQRLRTWNAFSNSSPVEGITRAIQTFYAPDKKISLYVFGDEFSGRSIDEVVETVDKINREDAEGNRLVRIHAIGFPVQFASNMQVTGVRFATLMRILCQRNGGTFVGLQDFRV